ncbi:hypothetical protein JYT94_00630 [bacterium AH-315-P11]|nr:hypothetical protein [bacterium AH-315-P11]
MPDVGYTNWNDERDICDEIDDVVMGALLTTNRVISGGEVTDGGGLDADYADMIVEVAGNIYKITGASIALTAAQAGLEIVNWIYVDNTGALTVATAPPAGDYVPLALADASELAVLRIADLRPFAAEAAEVENVLINPNEIINQRSFDGNWAGIAVGEYGHDRWRRGVTALTKEQPVINTSIHAGKYTLSWDGGGSGGITQSAASVGSGTSPLTVTLADQVQAEVIVPEDATNIRLVEGDIERPVRRRTDEKELQLCFPYYQKSYALETPPGAITTFGCYEYRHQEASSRTGLYDGGVQAITPMIQTPSARLYSPVTGASGQVYIVGDTDYTGSAIGVSQKQIVRSLGGLGRAVATGERVQYHWTAEAEI